MASENEEELMTSLPHSLNITEEQPASLAAAVAAPHSSIMQKFKLYETQSVITLTSLSFVLFICWE